MTIEFDCSPVAPPGECGWS